MSRVRVENTGHAMSLAAVIMPVAMARGDPGDRRMALRDLAIRSRDWKTRPPHGPCDCATAWIRFLRHDPCRIWAAGHPEDAECDVPAFRDPSGRSPVELGAMPGLIAFRLRDGSG